MTTEFAPIERIISGKGVITIPEDWGSALQIFLYTQVIRDVATPSLNLTFNPDKGFYAHITFCIDDFVLQTFDVNFRSQVFEILKNQESQNLLSLICAYDGILDSFVQVGNVIGVVLSRQNKIKSHPYLRFKPNVIRFECFSSCALKLTLKGTELVKCAFEDGSSTPPPPPPPPTPQVPSEDPVVVSPPLPPEQPGGGEDDTLPFPTDDFPPTETGTPGVLYKVIVRAVKVGTGQQVDFERNVYAPINNAVSVCELNGDIVSYSVGVRASGDETSGYSPGLRYIPFGGGSGGGTAADCFGDEVIISATPLGLP